MEVFTHDRTEASVALRMKQRTQANDSIHNGKGVINCPMDESVNEVLPFREKYNTQNQHSFNGKIGVYQ